MGAFLFLKKDYLFSERGEGRERGRETSISHAPNWGPGRNPGMCPDWELNQRPFSSQANAPPLSHTSQSYG